MRTKDPCVSWMKEGVDSGERRSGFERFRDGARAVWPGLKRCCWFVRSAAGEGETGAGQAQTGSDADGHPDGRHAACAAPGAACVRACACVCVCVWERCVCVCVCVCALVGCVRVRFRKERQEKEKARQIEGQ